MSLAEVAAVAITGWLASIAVLAYAMDAAGLAISPAVVLVASVTVAGTTAWRLSRHATGRIGDLVAWSAVIVSVFGWLVWIASPSLLPPGRGPDLTHHLLLIDYIERHWRLVHDLRLEGAMGEMAHYTPGAHLLAALFGAWTGTGGFRAIYPVVAACASLTAGFVFLITLRVLPRALPRVPLALTSVMLMLLPRAYFVDAFTHDSFLAQSVSALFAVAMGWACMVWDEKPSPTAAGLVAITALGVFLAWPVWVGPPLVVFLVFVMVRRDLPMGVRARHLAIGVGPLAALAAVHAADRLGWILLVRTSGAVLHPSIAVLGWVFPVLAATGAVVSIADRRARATLLLLAAIALQAITLLVMANSIGSQTPYMAYKMGYLAIYPLAVLAAFAVGSGVSAFAAGGRFGGPRRSSYTHTASEGGQGFTGSAVLAWAIVVIMGVLIVRPVLATPRPVPVVSRDFYEAGRWTRANVGRACVDYLVADANTAYWLHLAVLGNPRTSQRTAEVDRHNGRDVIAGWITTEGRPYAIADLTLLPDEIRNRVELRARFGSAGVIGRPGASPCEPVVE